MRAKLGDQEMAVLDFVLQRGPISVRETSEHFNATAGLARTTVQTVMERLRKKGFLRRKEQEGIFLYEAALEKDALHSRLIADFIRAKLGGSVSPLVSFLAQKGKLKDEELDVLRKIVEDQEKGK